MPIDYEATKRTVPKLKAMLTRAKRSGDPVKVLAAVEAAVESFDKYGWIDAWATWRAALDDAFFAFRRSDAYDDDVFENGGKTVARFEAASGRFA